MNKNADLLIWGRLISFIGSGMFSVCLPLFILKTTQSMADVGIFFAAVNMPAILLTPFMGVLIERWNLKKCLVYCDMISCALFMLLYILLTIETLHLPTLLIISILLQSINHCFSIASSSIFVHLMPQDDLEQMNAKKSLFDNAATLLAPILGTFLFSMYGLGIVIIINAFSYFLSALSEAYIHYQHHPSTDLQKSFIKNFSHGASAIVSDKKILNYFILVMILNFLVAPIEEVFAPGMLIHKYHIPDSLFGWTSSITACGVLLSSFFISRKKELKLMKYMKTFFYFQGFTMIFTGLSAYTLSSLPSYVFYYIYLIICFATGFIATLVNVPLIANFQVIVKPEIQARFFAMLTFFAQLMIPLGTYYAGMLSSGIGPDLAYSTNGITIIIFVYILFKQLIKRQTL